MIALSRRDFIIRRGKLRSSLISTFAKGDDISKNLYALSNEGFGSHKKWLTWTLDDDCCWTPWGTLLQNKTYSENCDCHISLISFTPSQPSFSSIPSLVFYECFSRNILFLTVKMLIFSSFFNKQTIIFCRLL